jgi:DNA-binding NarL/FixJ family response regulator
MINVLIVDSRPLLRAGLRALLDAVPDLTVRGEASSGREAVERARSLRVDVVLMAPPVLDRLVEELSTAPGPAGPAGLRSSPANLTVRELEVLRHVASGMSNREIASTLHVSETTIRTHIVHLLDKLDLRNRIQVAVYAHAAGITHTDGA